MNHHQTLIHDIILQRGSSLTEESYLQHHTGATEQSSDELYEMVSNRSVLHQQKLQLLELF